jgi:hypothetical protein
MAFTGIRGQEKPEWVLKDPDSNHCKKGWCSMGMGKRGLRIAYFDGANVFLFFVVFTPSSFSHHSSVYCFAPTCHLSTPF